MSAKTAHAHRQVRNASADKWLKLLHERVHLSLEKQRKARKPVKIAVPDSGIDPSMVQSHHLECHDFINLA